MAAQTDDKKLDGAGLATLWGIIKQYIVDNPSIPKATASVLGGIMVGTTLGVNNSGVLNLASGVVTAGTYKSVTVDTYGRVTAGANPNTLAGYGITDAKISNGSIILGENSITPITSLSGYATQTWVQQQGYLTEETYKGTVTQVKVGTTVYNPTSGVVSLPAYPTTLPASDVYSWAKAASKPSYTASEVGAATSGHTHTTSLASDTGTSTITLASAGKYKLTAGGTSVIFTMPTIPTVSYPVTSVNSKTGAVTLTASDVGAATSGHTHTTSIATSSGTNALTLAANTKYVLTAGGSTFIFTTPTDTNTWRPLGTGATDACAGNDSRLSDSRPASDVYSWAKASSKPTYTASEVGAATSSHTHTTSIATSTGTNQITLAHGGKYAITAGGTSYIFTMPSDNNTTYSAGTGLSLSGTTFSLATSGVTAGTYKRVTVDAYGRVTSGDNTDANDNTWRNIYTGGTSRVGTGTDTKAINFVAGSNVSISYEAAGTGSGQSGNANYFNVKIAATDTTYSAATQSAAGLMSAADKKKLDGIASGANAYSLPAASTSALGGIKVNYTNSGKNYKVQLDSSNNAYVNVPWTDNNTTYSVFTDAAAGLAPAASSTNKTTAESAVGNYYLCADGKYRQLPANAFLNSTYTVSNGTYSIKALIGSTTTTLSDFTANQSSADDFTLVQGSNITFTVDATNRKLTIAGTANSTYPKAVKNITRSGTTFTATCYDDTTFTFDQQDNNTTYSAATQSAAGLMSAADKKKLDGIATSANNYSLPTASADTLGGIKVGTTLSISSGVLNLATSGVTAGTYKRVTVDSYGRVTSGDNTDANDNTWRGIYVKGTSSIGTGTNTKALNFAAGSNVSISFAAAGTGSGQSGNANYGTITINATDTTYSAATQSAAGLMSAADKKKLDGIASGANAYSLPTASSSALGGIKVGASVSGKNYAVQLDSSNCAYVNVPWTDNNTTYTQASLGQVYAYSTPPTSGTAVTATNSDYVLATGGILAVQFDTNPVPASATLNVNSKGAKKIKFKKAALAAGVIKAGDLATFMYDGTQYELLTVDRTMKAVTDISRNGTTFTATCVDGSTFTFTQQDNNTTYTLAGLMGSSAKGGTTQPIYWNGSAFTNTTYTLGKSVPSDAVFTDHYAWSDITGKPLTLTKNTTGFSISGGTTSKTLTVGADYTLGAACAKGVTDNSSNTDVTSSDTNLITGRTLYYQLAKKGYTTNTGTVTSITLKAGTGISIDTNNTAITTSGTRTISMSSTYRTYASNGNTAYGWGNHANAGYASVSSLSDYLPLAGGTMTGTITFDGHGLHIAEGVSQNWTYTTILETGWNSTVNDWTSIGTAGSNGNTGRITLIANGNVGIGTTTPSHKLNVVSSDQRVLVLDSTSNAGCCLNFLKSGVGKAEIGYFSTSSYLYLYNYNANSEFDIRDDKTFMFTAPNTWLSQARLQMMRYDTTIYTDRACIGVTDGNLHIDSYPSHDIYINYYNSSTNFRIFGNCYATSYQNTSDVRKKNILSDRSYQIENIANAPIFQFTWKDTKMDYDLHIGSSAQYWKTIMPEAVTTAKDEMNTLSMQYDVIALASVVSVAKETLTLKEKVALLETRVESLEKKIREYELN